MCHTLTTFRVHIHEANYVEVREPSVSTMLMNFENKFDPYCSMSVPLYLTATFKQLGALENGPYNNTRSGNPTRDALERSEYLFDISFYFIGSLSYTFAC